MNKKNLVIAMAIAMGTTATGALAAGEQLQFTESQKLSDKQSPDMGMAFKTKLVRLGNGALNKCVW